MPLCFAAKLALGADRVDVPKQGGGRWETEEEHRRSATRSSLVQVPIAIAPGQRAAIGPAPRPRGRNPYRKSSSPRQYEMRLFGNTGRPVSATTLSGNSDCN